MYDPVCRVCWLVRNGEVVSDLIPTLNKMKAVCVLKGDVVNGTVTFTQVILHLEPKPARLVVLDS